jgi:glyoxylase-like metal-dependent hydrolase (beta-lactamase superfamily II)
MLTSAAPGDAIAFPYPQAPEPGTLVAVAPGIFWLRLALPFLLNHVNVYLVEDDGGWAVLDTGLGNDETRQVWESVFAGHLKGQRITRVVCSHYHPDHMGLVGWLTRRFECPLHVARTEFLMTKTLENKTFAANTEFYTERGLPVDTSGIVSGDGHGYLRLVTGLPTQYHRLKAGGTLRIGGRVFAVLTGGGHAPEQVMLHCAADGIFFSFDQVLTRISPNISVHAMEPEADPLGEYLASLRQIGEIVPGDALVLPGHHLPFTGLHTRLAELQAHHHSRCALIEEACHAEPRSAADLVPVLFKRQMDAHQTGFAFGETLAHVNYMRAQGTLVQARGADGILRTRTA